jgi:hypothetical protein
VARVLDRGDIERLVSTGDAIGALAAEHGAGRDVPLGDS